MATPSALPYPYAAAPDIIRAHQKDAYFKGSLANSLSDLHRRLLGVRSAHAWSRESRTFADALYLCLTTLVGNRTLGEEYCDVVQVHAQPNNTDKNNKHIITTSSSDPLPALSRRAAYIASSVVLPYLFSRTLPSLRNRLRRLLETRLARLDATATATNSPTDASSDPKGTASKPTRRIAIYRYLLAHLPSLTSSAPLHAVTLTTFYFTGTYYELAKRLLSLRYVFTRAVPSTPDRAGYELLGLLLLVQLSVQSYLHLRHALLPTLGLQQHDPSSSEEEEASSRRRESLSPIRDADVTLNAAAYATNTSVLLPDENRAAIPASGRGARVDLARLTNTPVPPTDGAGGGGGARYDLRDESVMAFVAGAQQRRCTLCLEEMRDPAATACGHVFCWDCIGDWVREKPECPLCRREATVQHILPLRVG
ncbi:hypothetical protein SODALDRAFT_335104 [Sodiomyces alkalinus F11]|uniref:RING-type E3 ubiquitin transferase n=1 Tax=Sodiomyces alkalinus (strain CBS 110278 / VKM F-3762 / F11) TaxID=1314773 RepID=A0A3N2PQX8_SODAK|nr:hypothetical protein SODALDRAFT_335104 [Sodiomyces alkalinus F11]ROT36888.1 hypothetical protein SODALDRAFT_335104 [Sodiomyces alkalinus F11]